MLPPLTIAIKKDGVWQTPEGAQEAFNEHYAPIFLERLKARLANKAEFAQSSSAQAPPLASKSATCAICDAPVQVREERESPMTCNRATCIGRFAQIAQRLGVGS